MKPPSTTTALFPASLATDAPTLFDADLLPPVPPAMLAAVRGNTRTTPTTVYLVTNPHPPLSIVRPV